MKKVYFSFLLACIAAFSYAQTGCPGCVIDVNCNIPGGGLCPDSLPGATYGQPYSEDITFYLPNQVFVSQLGQNCTLLNLRIDAVSGLPFGITWECNNSQNGCNYVPANSNLGCVRICGTPIANPGIYNITVFCTGTVDAGIFGNQSGPQNFNFQMVVFPDTTTNSGFGMSPALGCAPLTVAFTNNFPSNGYVPVPNLTGGYAYSWDFGNGQQSNIENPPPVTYFTPGSYEVTYQAVVDTFGFRLTELTLTSVECTDPTGAPDPYIKVFNNSGGLVFSNENNYCNNCNPPITITFPNNGIAITDPPYRIEVWDYDCCDANDECFNDSEGSFPNLPLSLPPVNAYGTSTLLYSNGGTQLSFNYKHQKNVFQINVTDTVEVFALPPVTPIAVSPATIACPNDSILLSVYPGYGYEWFLNDTVLVVGATAHQHYARTAGKYTVRIYDLQTGCSTYSYDTTISFYPGIPGNFAITYNSANGTLNSNISGNYTYQWLIWNGSAFVNISGETNSSYTPLANGQYVLIATDANGCFDSTFAYTFNSLGVGPAIAEMAGIQVFPNPATDWINLAFTNGWDSPYELKILDISGRMLYSSAQPAPAASSQIQLNLNGYNKGIYILELTFPEGSIRERFVKY